MYLTSNVKSECCGCGACLNVCPKKAISMNEDDMGFLYPTIEMEECVNCHLCEKVCPVVSPPPNVKSC